MVKLSKDQPEIISGQSLRIAVVGGGVVGVSTGLALLDEFKGRVQVDIISDKWTPHTTGDVSAGLIYPYLIGSESRPCQIRRILEQTCRFYSELIRHPSSGHFGLSLITMYELSTEPEGRLEVPDYPGIPDIRIMGKKELGRLFPGLKRGYQSGLECTTYIAEPTLLLPFLMERFENLGGQLKTRKVSSLGELLNSEHTYDLVINCAGLGARYLQDVQDHSLEAVRGQVIRVRAPWIRHAVMAGKYYILPNRDCVVLGGTKEKADYNLKPNPVTAHEIMEGCAELIPSLRQAQKVADCVGLRPYRPAVRIEVDPNYSRIIHNYGHGGSGVTLCWGSALEVVGLVKQSVGRLQAKL